MKKVTIITMQLKTPGGIERFVTTLANMFAQDFEVELVSNYGKVGDKLAFPVNPKVKTTFLTPVQPAEVSMKNLITSFKWHLIPKEIARRKEIYDTKDKVFDEFLRNLKTDFIITDRAEYNSLVKKFYSGSAVKIATDHNYHQKNQHYIEELMDSIKDYNYLVVATDELKKDYEKLTTVKCVRINNPLNIIPNKKSDLKTKNLISIGRFVPEKDFETLVDVMAKVHAQDKDIHLIIIGDGVTFPSVQAKIKKLGLEKVISLPGFLSQKEIEKYYYDSSLFVLTSKTEAFGLVLAEAMSYGLPCIAFDRASGARAQIQEDTGVLIPNAETDKMATKIVELLNDKNKLQSFQKAINKTIDNYDLEQIQKEWHKIVY